MLKEQPPPKAKSQIEIATGLTRLQIFQKRLRGRGREELTIRDKVTIAISTSAFAVSLVTAYFNLLNEVDDVRLVVGDGMPPVNMADGLLNSASETRQLMFINGGNRAAVVTGLDLVVQFIPTFEARNRCEPYDGIRLAFDFTPLAIEPGKIISLAVQPHEKALQGMALTDYDFRGNPLSSTERYAVVCFRFSVVSKDNVRSYADVPWWKVQYSKGQNNWRITAGDGLFDLSRPQQIIYSRKGLLDLILRL